MIPAGVRAALRQVPLGPPCCRWAELVGLLRVSDAVHLIDGMVVIAAELPSGAAVGRLTRLINSLAPGTRVEVTVPDPGWSPDPVGPAQRTGWTERVGQGPGGWVVRVTRDGDLARSGGLLDRCGRPVEGLPRRVLAGGACDAAALWRGALLARGELHSSTRGRGLQVGCPNTLTAVALVGLARRLHTRARVHPRHDIDYAILTEPAAVTTLLTQVGGEPAARASGEVLHPPHARATPTPRPAAELAGANTRRVDHAAAEAITAITAAFAALGEQIPPPLREAGQLRLTHPHLSLGQLAYLADPPVSKDTLSGRIRRLLALAHRYPT